MKQLSIGDSLYRHVTMSGIWHYLVVGIHQYEGCQQYVVESQSCSHGWKCKLLIADDGKGVLRFVSHLNDDESDSQHYWHTDKTAFWQHKDEAHRECYRNLLQTTADEVTKADAALKSAQKRLAQVKEALELAESKLVASRAEQEKES